MITGDVRACSVEDCWSPVLTRGWCRAHYKRAMVYGGDPLGGRHVGTQARIDDIAWMVECDESPEAIADRQGVQLPSLLVWLRRNGAEQLAEKLAAERPARVRVGTLRGPR